MKFIVPGPPVPKGRPRLGRNGNVYTPQRTRDYEELVGWYARQKFPEPLKGPVGVWVAIKRGGSRMDGDNALKCIMDACNGIAYLDDKQVVDMRAWFVTDGEPRAEVEIWAADVRGRRTGEAEKA